MKSLFKTNNNHFRRAKKRILRSRKRRRCPKSSRHTHRERVCNLVLFDFFLMGSVFRVIRLRNNWNWMIRIRSIVCWSSQVVDFEWLWNIFQIMPLAIWVMWGTSFNVSSNILLGDTCGVGGGVSISSHDEKNIKITLVGCHTCNIFINLFWSILRMEIWRRGWVIFLQSLFRATWQQDDASFPAHDVYASVYFVLVGCINYSEFPFHISLGYMCAEQKVKLAK